MFSSKFIIKCLLEITSYLRRINIVVKPQYAWEVPWGPYWLLHRFWISRFMVFNATFNNISILSWWPVLLVEETGVPGEYCIIRFWTSIILVEYTVYCWVALNTIKQTNWLLHRFWTSIILVEYIEWDICAQIFYLVIYNVNVYLQTPSVRITSVVPSPILLRKSPITGKFFCFKIPFTHVVCSYNEIHSFLIKHITISLIHKFTKYWVIINPCNTPIKLVCKNHLWILKSFWLFLIQKHSHTGKTIMNDICMFERDL